MKPYCFGAARCQVPSFLHRVLTILQSKVINAGGMQSPGESESMDVDEWDFNRGSEGCWCMERLLKKDIKPVVFKCV